MAEFFDVLTDAGAATGIVKERHAVHRVGDWHRAGHVWVVWADRVLLQRRALMKDFFPGAWDVTVAGHVSAGERALDAVIREAHEELGLVIAADELRHLGTLRYHYAVRDDFIENEFHDVYLLRRDVDVHSLTLDPLEVAEVRWVPHAELGQYSLVPHDEEYSLLADAIIRGL
jgi:isopentenyl-diphosphate Delta-isomerase